MTDQTHDEQAETEAGQNASRVSLTSVAEHATTRLKELTGRPHETVASIEQTEDGWTVQIETVESRRIPDTSDILALYQVDLDDVGRMTGYRRLRRYARGRGDEG